MTRKKMIEKLITDDVNTIISMDAEGDTEYIYNILYYGIKGYKNYTTKELKKEYNERFDM